MVETCLQPPAGVTVVVVVVVVVVSESREALLQNFVGTAVSHLVIAGAGAREVLCAIRAGKGCPVCSSS